MEEKIVQEVNNKFDKLKLNRDYKIVINDLDNDDIVQDETLTIKVVPIKKKKMTETLFFKAKLEYDYEPQDQLKVINKILKPTTPNIFWEQDSHGCYEINRTKNVNDYFKIGEEVKKQNL